MGRTAGELPSQLHKVDGVFSFKRWLTNLVLLTMMMTAQADYPAIRGF